MNPAALDELESAFRHAVAGSSFTEARDLLSRYCAEAGRTMGGNGSGNAAPEVAARVTALLHWGLRAVHAGRAQRRLELSMLLSARRYRNAHQNQATLKLDA